MRIELLLQQREAQTAKKSPKGVEKLTKSSKVAGAKLIRATPIIFNPVSTAAQIIFAIT